MGTFESADGTRLAYHLAGAGRPLICLPGGPMLASAYLGDLGGLSAQRSLVLLDLRGTGDSAVPADPATYQRGRQVEDVEALRVHLGLDRLDIAAHSAGASLAVRYAARHPDRVSSLLLLNPSPRAVDLEIADQDRRELAELRRGEPWFPRAFAAYERIAAGQRTDADWAAITPFMYGRWDSAARAHNERLEAGRNATAGRLFYAADATGTDAVRAAIARLEVPVLIVAGEYDAALPPKRAAEYAALFPRSELVVQPAAGHYPWVDDPESLVATLTAFYRQR